jgi:hypothetical protein
MLDAGRRHPDAGGFYVFVLMSGEPLELRAFWAGVD